MPLAPPQNLSQEPVSYFAQVFDMKWGQAAGDTYTQWANAEIAAHPSFTPYQLAKAFAVQVAAKGLAKALQDAATATAKLTGQATTGAATGAANALQTLTSNPLGGIASILSGLASGAFWLRAAEVLMGLVLAGIGLNAMLRGRPLQVVTRAAGAAAKVVP